MLQNMLQTLDHRGNCVNGMKWKAAASKYSTSQHNTTD
uniref:Uncharacterized protein n=1 Tax=Arundo donax TaxID=35708 RepID=A0A0A9C744_ARUDO